MSDGFESTDLRVERRVAAPPTAVYAYLTDSVRWARWQGVAASIDPVPGGPIQITMATGQTAEGRFVELVPNRRVVFTWGWTGSRSLPPGSSTVEIELIPDGEGTVIALTHRGLPREDRALHEIGWAHYMPRLTAAVEGLDVDPDPGPG
jgi:uncharacterized protein YndB with AHSA1/START domain